MKCKASPAVFLILAVYVFCLVLYIISPYSYSEMCGTPYESFSSIHLFGTDANGRDVMTRVCFASLTSVHIGILSALCGVIIGVPYGCIAGLSTGLTNLIMVSILDILESIPEFLYAMMLMAFFSGKKLPDTLGIFLTLSIVSWIPMARIIRNQTMNLMTKNYIRYAIIKKASLPHIIKVHLLPNMKGTILSVLTQKIPSAIFLEAFLSFVGIGIQPPKPSLGKLISESIKSFRKMPSLLVIPSIFLLLIIFAFNSFSNQLEGNDGIIGNP